MALLHRTNKQEEALEAGYKIEDTGILEIEKYLQDTLFGANSNKSELLIESAKSQLKKSIEKEIKSYNYDLILLSKSKDELEEDLEEFNKKKKLNNKIFSDLKQDMNNYKNDAKEYIKTLETFLNTELLELQNIIRQRVYNDVKYSFEKTKKRPNNTRIKTIIQTAIKDGIIDVIRDYRYKFIKKSQSIGEICEQKYHDLGFVMGHKNDNFDARGFFKDDFKVGFLTSSNDILVSKITNEVLKSKASKLNTLNTNLETVVKEEFSSIEKDILQKAKTLSEVLIENFFKEIEEPLKVFEHKLQKDEKSLAQRIANFEENELQKDDLTINIHNKIKNLNSLSKGLR